MPKAQIAIKTPSNFGLTALRNIIIDGKDSVVTPIIKASTVPSCAPFPSKASAMGIVPKISAYMGMPMMVANITPNGLWLARHNPAFWNPVVNDSPDAYADENVRKDLLEGFRYLILGIN